MRRRHVLLAPAALVVSMLCATVAPRAADPVAGSAVAVDGRTLAFQDAGQYRLRGINVPAAGSTCRAGSQTFDCARVAKAQLDDLVAGADVVCTNIEAGPGAVPLADCRADGYDLARGMIYAGWAVAADGAAKVRLGEVERAARAAPRGIWRLDERPDF